MGMGRYGIVPYMRGGGAREGAGAEVDLRVHHGDRGAGRMDRLPTTPAACGYDA